MAFLDSAEARRRRAYPARRAEMDRLAQLTEGPSRSIAHWAAYRVEATSDRGAKGRMLGELGQRKRKVRLHVLADLVVADGLRTVISKPGPRSRTTPAKARRRLARSAALVGASDAGAHLDMIDEVTHTTTLLARAVRERQLLPRTQAVATLLTPLPVGSKDRGRSSWGPWRTSSCSTPRPWVLDRSRPVTTSPQAPANLRASRGGRACLRGRRRSRRRRRANGGASGSAAAVGTGHRDRLGPPAGGSDCAGRPRIAGHERFQMELAWLSPVVVVVAGVAAGAFCFRASPTAAERRELNWWRGPRHAGRPRC